MKFKLVLSLWLFAITALLGARLGEPGLAIEERLFSAFLVGYTFWALYWGVPVVFGWWWPLRHKGSFLLQVFAAFVLLPICCLVFSLYGGGIYQFARTWWLHSRACSEQLRATERR